MSHTITNEFLSSVCAYYESRIGKALGVYSHVIESFFDNPQSHTCVVKISLPIQEILLADLTDTIARACAPAQVKLTCELRMLRIYVEDAVPVYFKQMEPSLGIPQLKEQRYLLLLLLSLVVCGVAIYFFRIKESPAFLFAASEVKE